MLPFQSGSPDTPNPAAYYGLQDMALEDRIYVDMSATQRQLTRAKLEGKAGEIQTRCWLDGSWGKLWLSAAVEGILCDSDEHAHDPWLFKSAKEQCGAWCLWDLRSTNPDGWLFKGNCFKPFRSTDRAAEGCLEWFSNRPAITFIDTSLLSV